MGGTGAGLLPLLFPHPYPERAEIAVSKQLHTVKAGREYLAAFAGEQAEEYNLPEYAWVSAFAAHNYHFVKRLTAISVAAPPQNGSSTRAPGSLCIFIHRHGSSTGTGSGAMPEYGRFPRQHLIRTGRFRFPWSCRGGV